MAPEALEIATSFVLPSATPRQYNVFFASVDFSSRYSAKVQPLRNAWQGYALKELAKLGPDLSGQSQNPSLAESFFSVFAKQAEPLELYTQLNHGFFWHAGEYRLELEVRCAAPVESVKSLWRFTVTQEDEQSLRLNVITLLKEICGLPVVYNFVYRPYEPVP